MNKTLVILTIAVSTIVTVNSAFADSVKLVNPANNHVYKRFDKTVTWTQAKNACTNQKGYLATITSQAENDWIVSKNLQQNYPWLGASDSAKEGQWVWITGETWNYTNWNDGEPNGARSENYLVIWNESTGQWNDLDKSNPLSYLCEWDKPLKNYTNMITTDTNNDNASEFVLIGNNGAVNKVVSIDRQNKTVISEVDFSAYPTYSGISLSVVDDMNNNGKAEFSLLLTKKSDGSSVIETRDSGTGELLESYVVPR
jgi:hypothetical protein